MRVAGDGIRTICNISTRSIRGRITGERGVTGFCTCGVVSIIFEVYIPVHPESVIVPEDFCSRGGMPPGIISKPCVIGFRSVKPADIQPAFHIAFTFIRKQDCIIPDRVNVLFIVGITRID